MITAEGTIPFPPTDPQAVSAFGAHSAQVAGALRTASTQLTSVTTAAASAWTGQAADAFQAKLAKQTASLSAAADQVMRVQPVIATYAGKMAEAEGHYNTAVQQQMAAIAAGPSGLADEAAAIAQEAVALAQLEAAGVVCAGELTGITAALLQATFSLSASDIVGLAADAAKSFANTAAETAKDMTKVVSGYTTKAGTEVKSYVRYAEGLAAKYGPELSASALREGGELAEDVGEMAEKVSKLAVVADTYERDEQLVKKGVPEPYALAEAVVGRVGPAVAGAAAGVATETGIEALGAAGGAAAGSVVPVAGTAAGAVEGAVAASIPAVIAGGAVSLGTTKVTQFGADYLTDRLNEMWFPVKTEGPRETVPPPSSPDT